MRRIDLVEERIVSSLESSEELGLLSRLHGPDFLQSLSPFFGHFVPPIPLQVPVEYGRAVELGELDVP